jgi:hypothetical protein
VHLVAAPRELREDLLRRLDEALVGVEGLDALRRERIWFSMSHSCLEEALISR